jgi:acyl-homoserine-lactone acylase
MKTCIYFLFLLLSCGCTADHNSDELNRWKEYAENTLIIRDDFGIPHIYGKRDEDAVFGLLYAQCEDDFYRVEHNYISAIGRLAEIEGEEFLYEDLRANLFMTREEAISYYENSPKWLRNLCNAFADGVNYYLYTHPDTKPRLLTRFEPWMAMYFSEGSIGGDLSKVPVGKIRDFYEKITAYQHKDNNLQYSQTFKWAEPSGSNGIAISGELTESGNTLLLINPHTTFYFRGEAHVVSEEGLNAYGAVTWGQFFIYQGFNEKTGWMHTSCYVDVIDEFLETVEEREGKLVYKYGDELRPVETLGVTLKYKNDGEIREKVFPIYRTHHGPITHMSGDKWVSTAMMWNPDKSLQQSYLRTKAQNQREWGEMMKMCANSSNNTTYADSDGNIAYYHGNFIPRRDTIFDFSKPVDGSDPATDWQGLHKSEETIHILNPFNGWIQNCNSTPFLCCAECSPEKSNYPYYMATEPQNFRGVNAINLLKGRDDFTLDKLVELAYDSYLPGFEKLIAGLTEAYDKSPEKDPGLEGPVNELRKWDLRTSAKSVALSLAHFYGTLYLQKGEIPDGLSQMEAINYFGTESPHEERLDIFTEAVEKIKADFGKWDTPWGEINRFQRLDGSIYQMFDDSLPSLPVRLASGTWGSLAAYGIDNKSPTRCLYGNRGNSFVAVVEFGERVRAKSVLVGGQSGDPDSPHFLDQAQRYIDADFKDVAYYREDVEKRAVKKYHPGER